MLLMYRIARLLAMNSTSSTLTTRSTVIARAGHVVAVQQPSCLIVMSVARDAVQRARPASAVDEIIDRNRLRDQQHDEQTPADAAADDLRRAR